MDYIAFRVLRLHFINFRSLIRLILLPLLFFDPKITISVRKGEGILCSCVYIFLEEGEITLDMLCEQHEILAGPGQKKRVVTVTWTEQHRLGSILKALTCAQGFILD